MESHFLTRFRWTAIQGYERVGGLSLLGLGMLILALAVHVLVVHPLNNQLLSARARGADDREQRLQNLHARLAEENRPALQYAAFLGHFSSPDRVLDRLVAIFNAAERAGLVLRQGDYQLSEVASAPLRELRVTLPVSGSYTAIRYFVTTTLEQIPTAALEQIRFQRRKATDPAVEAEIRFTLYLLPNP